MNKILSVAVLGIILMAFGKPESDLDPNKPKISNLQTSIVLDTLGARQFWNTLKGHCGKAYKGEIASGPAGDDFNNKRLVMHVLSCSDNEILIPFNVGEDRSRTWVLKYKNGRIELKHDHRHEDGTSDKVTMYGGTTSNGGLPGIAVFPADEETTSIIPAAATNVWWITIDETKYTYNLRRIGSERLFSVSFDLTKEIEKPEPSWGWEGYGKQE